MMRSLFSAVSGLRNHQVRMDVVGNNVANVNTVGFKTGRVTFQELFNQTLRGAASPREESGGTNPQQIGLGSALSSIDVIHTQGSLQVTGRQTDLGLQGSGFFVLQQGASLAFSRVGAFDIDADGYLVDSSSGLRVLGWQAVDAEFGTRDMQNLSSIRLPVGQDIPATATGKVGFSGNMDSLTEVGSVYATAVDVFDSLGSRHLVEISLEKTGPNEWTWTASGPDGIGGASGTLTFSETGQLLDQTGGPITFNPEGAESVSLEVSFASVSQMAGETTTRVTERDGHSKGSLEDFTIDASGITTGLYSNGLSRPLAQVAVATFPNPSGLLKSGENLFLESNNSGLSHIGEAGTGGRGQIMPGTLEMSNVDLAREFTDMIITQRGFQANSRLISVTDEMLQELVNMKR